jgi:threonine dehydratase
MAKRTLVVSNQYTGETADRFGVDRRARESVAPTQPFGTAAVTGLGPRHPSRVHTPHRAAQCACGFLPLSAKVARLPGSDASPDNFRSVRPVDPMDNNSPACTLVSIDAVRSAAARIAGVAIVTPLLEVMARPAVLPASMDSLLLKCENLQRTGAFKIRGAYNMLARLSGDELRRGVITYSSGNHGQALAVSALLLGARATVVMPKTAPRVKVDAALGLGAEVLFEGTTSVQRRERAEAEAAARGLTMVPPFDHPWIIEGQGTVGLEILEQCREAGTVLVQIGGGGLISGIAVAIKGLKPSVRIVGIEPSGAAKMKASIDAGRPVSLASSFSVADGLMPVRPADLTFAHVRALVDELVTVPDEETTAAVAWLFRHARLVVEPSGAITVAAALRGGPGWPQPVVAVLSGGNVAPENFAGYVAHVPA